MIVSCDAWLQNPNPKRIALSLFLIELIIILISHSLYPPKVNDTRFCLTYCTTAFKIDISCSGSLAWFIAKYLFHSFRHPDRMLIVKTKIEPNFSIDNQYNQVKILPIIDNTQQDTGHSSTF